MGNRYSDRLEFSNYRDEEPVAFGLAPSDQEPDLDSMVAIPETLVARLVGVAGAYGLHLLPMIDVHGETRFNPIQREGVLEELAFIQGVLRDPAAAEALGRIQNLAETGRHLDLVVSGP